MIEALDQARRDLQRNRAAVQQLSNDGNVLMWQNGLCVFVTEAGRAVAVGIVGATVFRRGDSYPSEVRNGHNELAVLTPRRAAKQHVLEMLDAAIATIEEAARSPK